MKNLFFLFIVIFTACGGNSPKTNSSNVQNDSKKSVDLPIEIKVVRENKSEKQRDYLHFYLSNESDNDIYINPSSGYYDKYTSGQSFNLPEVAYISEMGGDGYTENSEFLSTDYYIVNNTENALSINGLDIVVHKSEIDKFPYIHVASEEKYSNTLVLANESWSNWESLSFRYKILKKDEDFDGNYQKEKQIEYFEDIKRIDFLPDLIEKGYDFETVKNKYKSNLIEQGIHENKEDDCMCLNINNENFDQYANLFYPFEIGSAYEGEYYGFARICGEISFSESDFRISFSGKIFLSTQGGFGGGLDINDSYNVKLQSEGQDYIKHFPYITKIEPGGSERVNLTFMCSKSSNHIFFLRALNDNDLTIESKKIHFHFLLPKHSVRAANVDY